MTIIALAFIYPNKLNEFLEHELSDKLIQSYRDDLDFQNIIGNNITIIYPTFMILILQIWFKKILNVVALVERKAGEIGAIMNTSIAQIRILV